MINAGQAAQCIALEQAVAELGQKYQEELVAQGVVNDNVVIEIFASPSGSFTIAAAPGWHELPVDRWPELAEQGAWARGVSGLVSPRTTTGSDDKAPSPLH